jgi:hypothetical protein
MKRQCGFLRVAAWLALAVTARSADAQQRGTMELGAFGTVAAFDDTLLLSSGLGGGLRVGMFVVPRLSIEFEHAWLRATRPLGLRDVNVGIISTRATGVAYSRDRLSLLVGAGAGISTETNFLHAYGVQLLGGVRYGVNDRVSVRLDGVVDWLSDQDWKTYQSVRLGVSWFRHP